MTANGEIGAGVFDLSGSGAEPLEEEDPRTIGSIPLAGRLGAGGMGRVYLGVHEGRYVAVKQVLPSVVAEDKDFLRRFGHELDNLALLPAEATAPLLAGDGTARPPWFATAYVPGVTLREAVELNEAPLPADALWTLLREAASGLAAVHALDMVHRDLKPSNVMVTLDGATLIDFGVARAAEQSKLTVTGMVVGTPAYMAPEQASGARSVGAATDVFALGSVLAYAASGRPPFGDESGHGVLYRIVHEEPDLTPVRDVDPELADLLAVCLDKDPGARPTAADLFERASGHGPFAAPLWPRHVTEHLAERAAFAAHVQEIDVPPPAPEPAPEPTHPLAEPNSQPPKDGPQRTERPEGPEGPKRRRRRTRVLLAVVPVVVATGTTLAIQYLPNVSSPDDEAGATPSASARASITSTPSASGGSASPGKEKGKADAEENGEKGKGEGKGEGGSQASGAGGVGTGGQDAEGNSRGSDGSGEGGDAGGSGDSGDADGSAGAGGSSGSGGSGGTSAGGEAGLPSSGTHRYRNGNSGKCLTTVYSAASSGGCSDSTASWTVRSTSGGGFELVNTSGGQCLSANMLGQAVFVSNCGASSTVWRAGSGSTVRSVSNGGCLDLGQGGSVTATTCAGKASQRWTTA